MSAIEQNNQNTLTDVLGTKLHLAELLPVELDPDEAASIAFDEPALAGAFDDYTKEGGAE